MLSLVPLRFIVCAIEFVLIPSMENDDPPLHIAGILSRFGAPHQ